MLGTTVGQYRIAQKLGAGGMGVVYLAEHTLLGRPAAVKMLLPDLSRNREVVTRFFNEARAATAIRHPGIVEIYDFGFDTEGAAYIVMEFLRGESLATRAKRGRLPYANALFITRQVAGALAAAHAAGIVHRDLKPDNVFLVPDPDVPGGERIKLLDFGIAKLAGDQLPGMEQMTQTGALMGTPRYMSPEQCRGVAVDHRSDLYSLGCMLFELCTGRGPFVGEGVGDVLSAHIHLAPPLLSSMARDVPPPLEHLVQRLLVKDPAQRIATAAEVVHAVDQVMGQGTQPPGSPYAGGGSPRPGAASEPPHSPTGPSLRDPPVPLGAPTLATGPHLSASSPGSLTTLSRGAASLVSHPPVAPARARGKWIAGAAIAITLGAGVAILSSGSGEPGAGVAPAAAIAPPVAASSPPAGSPPAGSPPAGSPPAGSSPPPSSGQPDRPLSAAPAPPEPAPAAPPSEPAPSEPPAPALPAEVALIVESQPPGAEVVLEGRVLGKTPYRGAIPRAEREVALIVRLADHKERKLKVRADAPISRTVKLDKKPRRGGGGGDDDDRDDSVNPFAK
jgi:eukaryotic-like serine/threonine-protein kinase